MKKSSSLKSLVLRIQKNLLIAALSLSALGSAHADRIKDVAFVRGVRDNMLVGYGLVVGLGNTGDDVNSTFTIQSVTTMLRRLGVQIDSRRLIMRNVAAVMVTATLPPFARSGAKLDVNVSAMGNATSMVGGTLLETPLLGPDGKVYALAQGPLSIGGYDVSGRTGSRLQKNQLNSGRVPAGAMVEREVPADAFLKQQEITLALNVPDFTTAMRIAAEVNKALGGESAKALDPASVTIKVPKDYANKKIELIAKIEAIDVAPDRVAKVVINERTGTVVAGNDVRLGAAAVAHGSLIVEVKESVAASQPAPFSNGTSQVVQNSEVAATEKVEPVKLLTQAPTLNDVVKVLNGLGASPRDLMAILQALKRVGALNAEVEMQ